MLQRIVILCLCAISLAVLNLSAKTVIVDAKSGETLPGVSIFNGKGRMIGTSGYNGTCPSIDISDYPLRLRYMGYHEKEINYPVDTVRLEENIFELSEIVVESAQAKWLHILAYVRETSTLSTYTDTILMFREKLVDFMLPPSGKTRFEGWRLPRILSSKSYYQFTDNKGLDSVSDKCNNHFSWSDWMGLVPPSPVPSSIALGANASDTVWGKYSPAEIWLRRDDRLALDVNVLADTVCRRWVPELASFFRNNVDFEQFRVRYNFDDGSDASLSPLNLNGYSFNIESRGRGRSMFKFNRVDEPCFVATYAETYILDREYITLKEAKKWSKKLPDSDEIPIIGSDAAPPLSPEICSLISRVESIDINETRSSQAPDKRIGYRPTYHTTAGALILKRIKGIFGIDKISGKHKQNKKWKDFREDRKKRNRSVNTE